MVQGESFSLNFSCSFFLFSCFFFFCFHPSPVFVSPSLLCFVLSVGNNLTARDLFSQFSLNVFHSFLFSWFVVSFVSPAWVCVIATCGGEGRVGCRSTGRSVWYCFLMLYFWCSLLLLLFCFIALPSTFFCGGCRVLHPAMPPHRPHAREDSQQ